MKGGLVLLWGCAGLGAAVAFFAQAAEATPFPQGRYSSEKACPSQDIHSKGEPTFLDVKGLEAIEWNCEFVEVRSVFGGHGWLIDAACNAPGEFYPQQFVAVIEEGGPKGPARLKLTAGGDQPTETEFHRCR